MLVDVKKGENRVESDQTLVLSRNIDDGRNPSSATKPHGPFFSLFFYGFGPVLFFVLGWNCSPYHIFMTSNSRHTRSINEIVLEDRVHIWSERPRNKIIGWK